MDSFPFARYPPPDIRHFRSPPNFVPQSFTPQNFQNRQPSNSHLDYINLRKNLESQKNSSRINLNDNYIRDEGCKIVGDFLQANPQISMLELKGNNITGKGLNLIIQALQNNYKLKSLNLEWNSIGLDASGLEILANYAGQSNSLNHLDIRNNRITSNDANTLSNLIKNSKSLISIDVRWNELGNIGGKEILTALKENRILQVLEISGNNISEELIKDITYILERNRQTSQNPTINKKKYDGFDTLNERDLGAENDKNQELVDKNDYVRRLEKELQEERNYKLESQGKFEQEFQKFKAKEFEMNKIIHDLELKNDKFLSDNRNLKQNFDRISIELELARSNNSEINKLQEVKLQNCERELQESEKRHFLMIEKVKEENEFRLREISLESENRIKSLEEHVRELQNLKINIENELKRAVETGAKLKLQHEDQIRELQYKLSEQDNMRYISHLKSLEGRLKVLEENRELLNRKNLDLLREIRETESQRIDNSSNYEREVHQYKEENEGLTQKIRELEMLIDKYNTDMKLKDNLIEKLEHEINDLNDMIESFKNENKDHFQIINDEHRQEIKFLQDDKEIINAKLHDIQNAMRNCSTENMRLRHEYQRLADFLQSTLNKSVMETFTNNNFI